MAVPSQAGLTPIAPMNINGRSGGGGTAANSNQQPQQGEADFGEGKKQNGLVRLLTCGCFR